MLSGPDTSIGEEGTPYVYGSESDLGPNVNPDLGFAVGTMLSANIGESSNPVHEPIQENIVIVPPQVIGDL